MVFRFLFRSIFRSTDLKHQPRKRSLSSPVQKTLFVELQPTHEPIREAPAQAQRVAPPASSASQQAVPSTVVGKCYVVDGDTIQIGKVRLRLAGIDAPELDHPWGKKAKWELVRLCKGQVVTAKLEPELSYDRPVATCYLPDGRDLSAEMVKAGLALDWPKFSGGKYASLETDDARKKHWKAAARQRGHMNVFNK
ncbi:MAG: thermonuclease family protein [Dinoroseobacter sp.]|nr:thermonuclease family protein [Dinoroseobacter sp.]